ncbi:MAG: type I methionyl aminopeptidase [Lachnospiraceae bacterium]|nr:type I methionyl aminopeptidase [Lachnospiraceae bacterium]
MSISIKSPREIELMRISNHMLCDMHRELEKIIRPGLPTIELDKLAESFLKEHGVVSNFYNYEGYPAQICVSVNDEVVHGIPSKEKVLHEGDIVSIDAGLIYKGYHSDAARTYAVGKISAEKQKLIDETRNSFFEGIKMARAGNRLYDISKAIDDYISQFGYGIVRDLVGHGVGTELHEEPQIPNFKQDRRGPRLQAGMTLAIEPMINLGRGDVVWEEDDWTVVSEDGSPSAHYENTILITDGDPEILSLY